MESICIGKTKLRIKQKVNFFLILFYLELLGIDQKVNLFGFV